MAYVICEPCVDIKDRACVEECPVDCIYEEGPQLYIHPTECVDCDACMPVCPVDAIFPQDDVPASGRSSSRSTPTSSPRIRTRQGGASQSTYAPQLED